MKGGLSLIRKKDQCKKTYSKPQNYNILSEKKLYCDERDVIKIINFTFSWKGVFPLIKKNDQI